MDDVAGPRVKVNISGSYVMVRVWSPADYRDVQCMGFLDLK